MTTLRILFFLLVPIFIYSDEIPGASYLELSDKIEILHIEVNDYTFDYDSTITYLRVIKDSNDKNVYIDYKENDTIIRIHYPDTTTKSFYLTKNYYYKSSHIKRIFEHASNAICLDDNNSTFFSYASNFDKKFLFRELSMNYKYNHEQEIMTISMKRGTDTSYSSQLDSTILNIKDSVAYYSSIENYNKPDAKEFFYRQYIYPSKNDSIFDYLDDFYKNGRHKIKLRPLSDYPPRKKKKLIKIGDTLDLNHQLIGVNKEDILLIEVVNKNKYTLIYNWGVWCGFCLTNTDNVKKINNLKLNDCSFITINCEGKRVQNDKVETYVEKTKTEYPVYISCEALEKNGIYTYPQTTLVDSRGIVVDFTTGGGGDFETFEKFLIKNNLID